MEEFAPRTGIALRYVDVAIVFVVHFRINGDLVRAHFRFHIPEKKSQNFNIFSSSDQQIIELQKTSVSIQDSCRIIYENVIDVKSKLISQNPMN
ncbi:hypothetical protein MAR_007406 [Mya arenaria]|uniref:Uncharacterized protein n=1 Tax=Mya arenaria TaxID=6604 RepID=A0ABY7DDY7_MYAAR|nr:hypothetical protein MAR_007406 [Mya arenaria]